MMKKITTTLSLLIISVLGFCQIPKDSLIAYYNFSNNAKDVT